MNSIRRGAAVGLTTLLAAAGAVVIPLVDPAAAAVPTFDRTLVGPGVAAMYPSGLEWDDVNDRLVIADTAGDQILVYSAAGVQLDAFSEHGTADGQVASPRDIAIDEAGNIYVADAENNRIQKFTAAGTWVWTRGGNTPPGCQTCLNTPIGVTWDAANDALLVASTGQNRIKAWDAAGTFLWQSPTNATTGLRGPRDASRGPDGRIWVSDYLDHQIQAYDVGPTGLGWSAPVVTIGVTAPGPSPSGQFNFPYNVDWSLDGNTMYVSDTGNGRISTWDVTNPLSPTFLMDIGGRCANHPQPCEDPPADAGKFNHLRRVSVDETGLIYGADFWGSGIEVFNPNGTSAGSIEGASAPLPGVAEAFSVDVAADGTSYVMDRNNHRIERFAPNGDFMNAAGARGTQAGTFSWPEALAVAPNGDVWVADTRGDRIQRWPADLATSPAIPSWGGSGGGGFAAPAGDFNYIEAIDVAPDGRVYIADTRNDRVQIFDPTTATFSVLGTDAIELDEPRGVAVTADAVFVADTFHDRVVKLSLTGTELGQFTGLTDPEGVDVAPDGTVWVADTGANRILHLSNALADLGDTFGTAGTGDTGFNLPHDVAATATELFVADTYNDRVQVYDLGSGGPDTQAPTGSATQPAAGATVSSPVTISGSAADNVGVASVEVAVQNTTTGQWLQAGGTFDVAQAWLPATLGTPGGTGTTWTRSATLAAGSYSFTARASDAVPNTATIQAPTAFTVQAGPDAQPPTGAQTSPVANATNVPSPVQFAGTASDNVGVATVEIAIKDTVTGQWLRADGSWGAAFVYIPTTVASPGATATTWSYSFAGTTPGRRYGVMARARDAAGNATVIRTFTNFTVTSGTGDAQAPAGTVTTPAPEATVPAPVAIAGTATDNVGVASVDIAIRNTVTGQWLRPNGTFATGFAWVPATVASPGATSTEFSFTFTPPAAQLWGLQARARDAAGNVGTLRSYSRFTSTTGGGGGELAPVPFGTISNAGGVAPLYPAGGDGDASGNRFIADSGGTRLVKIDAAGVQTPFSTTGWNDPRDLELLPDGSMWVVDTSDNQVVKVDATGAVVTEFAGFTQPFGLTASAAGVWVADTYAHRVVRIDPTTGAVLWQQTTCNSVTFLRPRDVALGSDGNVYVADTDRHRIVRLDPDTGACVGTTFGSQGGGNTQFRSPRSITSDGSGGLWIADAFNYRVVHRANDGTFIAATNGGYGAGDNQYRSAHCVFVDGAGLLNVCDTFGFRIQRYTVSAGVPTFASILGGTLPANGGFNGPFGVAYGPDGSLYVADWFNHRIQKFDPNGNFVLAFGAYGSQNGSLIFPRNIVVAPNGTELVVTDSENNRIDVFSTSGVYLRQVKPTTGVALSRPHQTAIAPDGSYWIADTAKGRIIHLNSSTGAVLHTTTGLGSPQGIAVEADGSVLVSNTNQNRVERYSSTGVLVGTVIGSGAGSNQVTRPAGLLLTGTGVDTRLWVAVAGHNQIGVFETNGTLDVAFGSAGTGADQFQTPKGVAVNPLNGRIAVADHLNNRISLWSPN